MKQVMHFLTEHLFDYAGLFPPAKLPLNVALNNYFNYQTHLYKKMLGKFILPIKLEQEYIDLTKDHHSKIPISLILLGPISDSDFEDGITKNSTKIKELLEKSPHTSIESFEIVFFKEFYEKNDKEINQYFINLFSNLDEALDIKTSKQKYDLFCEIPYLEDTLLNQFLNALNKFNSKNKNQVFIKLRTGGITPDLVPNSHTLSQILYTLGNYRSPFKVTAGLHVPIPNFNKDVGSIMHGYLNVFFASILSYFKSYETADFNSENITQELVCKILEKLHYSHLVVENDSIFLSTPNNSQKKILFTKDMIHDFKINYFKGIGTCDFIEPIEYLDSEIPFLN